MKKLQAQARAMLGLLLVLLTALAGQPSRAAPLPVLSAHQRYMAFGNGRFGLPEAKLTSGASTQYRFHRFIVATPTWDVANARVALSTRYSVVGAMTACGAPLAVDKAAFWWGGVEYPVTYKGAASWTIPDNTDILTDPLTTKTLPKNSNGYFSIATHSVNATDTYCVNQFIALTEQGETSQASSSNLAAQVDSASPTLTDATGTQMAPVMAMFGTGYNPATDGPVLLNLCDSIGDAKGYARSQAGARGAMGMMNIALDDAATGRISGWNLCSVGNSWASYTNAGAIGEFVQALVNQLGNVPFNMINSQISTNEVGSNFTAMQSHLATAKKYVFARWGPQAWVQWDPSTEATDATDFGATEANQSYLSSFFGPDPASDRRQFINWNNAGNGGDAYIDQATGVLEGTDTAKWRATGFSTTLHTAITLNQTTAAVLDGTCPALGINLVFEPGSTPDGGSGKYQVTTATDNGDGTCSVNVAGDQTHTTKFTTAHSAGVTVVGSYVNPDNLHPTKALHDLEAVAAEGQKSKFFALPYH
jgi:hypothetical protein